MSDHDDREAIQWFFIKLKILILVCVGIEKSMVHARTRQNGMSQSHTCNEIAHHSNNFAREKKTLLTRFYYVINEETENAQSGNVAMDNCVILNSVVSYQMKWNEMDCFHK